MTTPFLTAVLSIVRKDLQTELRSRELVSSMALFALLSILIFSFALELDRVARQSSVAGILWVTVVFACILGLNRNLAMEREGGNLDGMLIAPIARNALFCGKLIGNFIFAIVVGMVLLVLITVLYNVPMLNPLIILVLLLGTLGFSTVGTLLATMTVQTRARESLLHILMMPMALPVLMGAVRASLGIMENLPTDDWLLWIQILVAVDVIYLVLCFILFEYVIEE